MSRINLFPSCKALALAAWMAVWGLGLAQAQQAPAAAPTETADEKAKRESDLKALEEAMAASAAARRRLEAEIDEMKSDRARLNAALIDTAGRVRGTEDRTRALEQRLQTLTASEAAIRRSMESRRGVIVEVLAALQRMGRRPPPAVLVRPEDMLEAVRASILLGAVLPELRSEVEVLATDLAELVRLKQAIAADRAALDAELIALNGEQERLTALIGARQARMAEVEKNVGSEQEKAAGLARQAGTLKELIDRMEKEISGARQAADEARKAAGRSGAESRRSSPGGLPRPGAAGPKIPFAEAGASAAPVSGEPPDFGAPDSYGGTTRGISITPPKAAVVSPRTGGWPLPPFRSYGDS
jgi:septal ring factor EnvC (AmiA/AmiB activator)